jgi:hypothetical protein
MSADVKQQSSGELEQLTSAIREMASRVNAQFVVDDKKTQNFVAAGEQRDRAKKITLRSPISLKALKARSVVARPHR